MTNTLLATDRLQSPLLMRQAEKPTGISYGPYGHTLRADTPASGFTGQPCEQHLSWYLLGNGHRAYNPMIMRFHSPDGLSPFSLGGLNAYAYCHGDPINFHDRSGRIKGNMNQRAIGPIVSSVTTQMPSLAPAAIADQLPNWVIPTITNGANILGASQPVVTIGAHAVADKIKGTNNVNLKDPKTIVTAVSSTLAGGSAIAEAFGYPTSIITALFNGVLIAIGAHDTVDTISASKRATEAQDTVDGIGVGDAGHELLRINAGQQSFNTPLAKSKNKVIHLQNENAELRKRINRLERGNRNSNQL